MIDCMLSILYQRVPMWGHLALSPVKGGQVVIQGDKNHLMGWGTPKFLWAVWGYEFWPYSFWLL